MPQRLRAVRVLLLVAGGLAGVVGVACADGAATGAGRADAATARAAIAARELRAHLTDADRSASRAFLAGDVLIGGPGQQYRDAITGAGRALEQLAEVLGAGADSQLLQAIEAELVTYTGLVEQADAAFRAEAAATPPEDVGLGRAYLWYASKMLHEPQGGLLARVDGLVAAQERVLRAGSWWLGAGPLRVFLVVAVGWVGALVGVQLWLARRFRRVLNAPLALATVFAVLTCGWVFAGVGHVQSGFESAQARALGPLLGLWQVRSAVADADGQAAVLGVEAGQCPAGGACAAALVFLEESLAAAMEDTSVARRGLLAAGQPFAEREIVGGLQACGKVRADVRAGAVEQAVNESRRAEPAFSAADVALAEHIQRLDTSWSTQMAAAREVPGLRAGIVVPAALAVLLTAWGFGARLEEYRVRGRQ
jgi:hypothetical protein